MYHLSPVSPIRARSGYAWFPASKKVGGGLRGGSEKTLGAGGCPSNYIDRARCFFAHAIRHLSSHSPNTMTAMLRSRITQVAGLFLLATVFMTIFCQRPELAYGAENSSAAPVIVGFERFAAHGAMNSRERQLAGALLAGELNCTACHAADRPSATPIAPKQAPRLDTATARLKPDYMRTFIARPHAVKPGTTMPDVWGELAETERLERAEAIVHFLLSLGEQPRWQLPPIGARLRGEQLFHQVGCVACHGSRRDEPEIMAVQGQSNEEDGEPDDEYEDEGEGPEANLANERAHHVPLGALPDKYTLPSLTSFLLDPFATRPSGRMPAFNLTAEQSRDIAAYLLELPEVARVRYRYYEQSWNRLPDFDSLEPLAEGGAEHIDVSPAARLEQFGLVFEGFLKIEQPGEYRFFLGSDDGSRLLIDGQVVIDNDGVHAYSEKDARRTLEAGVHAVRVEYFEQAGDERLVVEFQGPTIDRQPLAAHLWADPQPAMAPEIAGVAWEVKPDLVEKGKQYFVQSGCAACHSLDAPQLATERPAVRPLSLLDPQRGCLADSPPNTAPNFSLTPLQRDMLAEWLRPAAAESFAHPEIIDLTFMAFNCYACHERDGKGGVQAADNVYFTTLIPEMGEEGRIPPHLNNVGGKLTEAWLADLFAQGVKARPYMVTVMPRFGHENIGHLVARLAAVDALPSVTEHTFEEPLKDIKEIGRTLVGEKGLSCIKCHTFGQFRSQGIQSIDMRLMGQRLRPEWFRPYLRNPQLFRPGTRMPAAWPATGKSFFTEFLDGDTDRQIEAVWLYLSDGERAKIPAGLVNPTMELVPVDHAIVYRNFIAGAGPRGIAVGYPEGIHQAFDADRLRLALLWKGRFIDASRHWSARGEGFEGPAGDSILAFPESPAFAFLDDSEQSWPPFQPQQYQFRGYRVDEQQRPTFRYNVGSVQIEDFLDTRDLGPNDPVTRRLVLRSDMPVAGLYWRVFAGPSIVEDEGWWVIDGTWRVRVDVSSGARPVVRTNAGGQSELLVPLAWDGRPLEIVQQFSW